MQSENGSTCVGNCTSLEGQDDETALSVMWILFCSFLVMSMQLGFAMLEVGSVREAHRMTVLAKNMLDSAVSCMAFWAYVYVKGSQLVSDENGEVLYHLVFFHSAFCATAVTICSGAMAERAHMGAYLCYAAVMAGIIYPVLADSAWGSPNALLYSEFHGRFVNGYSYHDFAGSGVVHFTGGCSALVGSAMLGRRIMRPVDDEETLEGLPSLEELEEIPLSPREKEIQSLEQQARQQERGLRPAGGWPRRFDDSARDKTEFASCTYLQVMGMFTLWVGWYAFNAGSTLSMDSLTWSVAGVVVWNTTVSAASGCLGTYIFCLSFRTHLDTSLLCNGTLAGLVAITASCDVASGGIPVAIGFVAGLVVYPLSSKVWTVMKFDDPVDAVAVHAWCGVWGVLAVAICKPDCPYFKAHIDPASEQLRFCDAEYSRLHQLYAQLWGLAVECGWAAGISSVLWGIFAISELTRAVEVEPLADAVALLCRMALAPSSMLDVAHGAPSHDAPPLADCAAVKEAVNCATLTAASDACCANARGETIKDVSSAQTEAMKEAIKEAAKKGERESAADTETVDETDLTAAASALNEMWKRIARQSPTARHILWQHGWRQQGGFKSLPDLWQLRQDLQVARAAQVESALEIGERGPLRHLAACLHACPLTRNLVILRLRIPPSAELSGLGSANTDGGQYLQAVRHSMAELMQASRDSRMIHSPLRREVRELSLTVQSQEVLLEALLRSSRMRPSQSREHRRWLQHSVREQLVSVPEQRGCCVADDAPLREVSLEHSILSDTTDSRGETPRGRFVPAFSMSSDRTVSDRSAGILTPHSAGEDTPPPTVIGRLARAPQRARVPDGADWAAQFADVLQANQQLLLALQRHSSTPGSSTPDSRGTAPRASLQLREALANIAAAQTPTPGHRVSDFSI